MKVLMYCQHVLGIGHLVRTTEIARAVSQRAEVTFVSGGATVDGFLFPSGVKLVQLPALQMDDEFSALESRGCAQGTQEIQDLRREQLLSVFDEVLPDILIIELFPFGRKRFAFELIPFLERARQRDGQTLVVCSLRDILVEKSDQITHEERVCRIVNTHFDLILVHGDPAFLKLDETFHRMPELRCEIRYTGFVQQRDGGDVALTDASEPTIVVSIGSGRYRQGQLLLESVIRAAALLECRIPHVFRVFAGPFIPDDVLKRLKDMAGGARNVRIERYSPNLLGHLGRADLSISMSGYNTIMNLLATGVRSLVYPYTANNNQEQHIRAGRLENLGIVELLHPEMLAAQMLGPKIAGMLSTTPARPKFDMNGAVNTAQILDTLHKRRLVREVAG
jgi:predicted glycosyltransferase